MSLFLLLLVIVAWVYVVAITGDLLSILFGFRAPQWVEATVLLSGSLLIGWYW